MQLISRARVAARPSITLRTPALALQVLVALVVGCSDAEPQEPNPGDGGAGAGGKPMGWGAQGGSSAGRGGADEPSAGDGGTGFSAAGAGGGGEGGDVAMTAGAAGTPEQPAGDAGAAGHAAGAAGGPTEEPSGGEGGAAGDTGTDPMPDAGAGGVQSTGGSAGTSGTGGGGGSGGHAGSGSCARPVLPTHRGIPDLSRPPTIVEDGVTGYAVDGSANVDVSVALATPAVLTFRVRVPADNEPLCDTGFGGAPVPNHAKLVVLGVAGADQIATNDQLADHEWIPITLSLPAGSDTYTFRGVGTSQFCGDIYPEPYFPADFVTQAFYVADFCLRPEADVEAEAPTPGCAIPASRPSASFELLGSLTPPALQGSALAGSSALAVSADGAVVVGGSLVARQQGLNVEHPFVWTASNGMVPLRSPQDVVYARSGGATLVSCDGAVAAGGIQEGFVWSQASGLVALQPFGSDGSMPIVMSADGSALFGTSRGDLSSVVRWDGAGAVTQLLPASRGRTVPRSVHGSSPEGAAILTTEPADYDRGAVLIRWTPEKSVPLVEFTLPTPSISGDLTTLVSVSGTSVYRMQHRVWETIPCLTGCTSPVVSWDGDQILFADSVWDELHGTRTLLSLLQSAGVAPPGVTITDVSGVSADGRVFVGTAQSGGRRNAFRAVLPNGTGP